MENFANIPIETLVKVGGVVIAGVLGIAAGYALPVVAGLSDLAGLAVTHNDLPFLKNNPLNNPDLRIANYAYAVGTIAGMITKTIVSHKNQPKISSKSNGTHFG